MNSSAMRRMFYWTVYTAICIALVVAVGWNAVRHGDITSATAATGVAVAAFVVVAIVAWSRGNLSRATSAFLALGIPMLTLPWLRAYPVAYEPLTLPIDYILARLNPDLSFPSLEDVPEPMTPPAAPALPDLPREPNPNDPDLSARAAEMKAQSERILEARAGYENSSREFQAYHRSYMVDSVDFRISTSVFNFEWGHQVAVAIISLLVGLLGCFGGVFIDVRHDRKAMSGADASHQTRSVAPRRWTVAGLGLLILVVAVALACIRNGSLWILWVNMGLLQLLMLGLVFRVTVLRRATPFQRGFVLALVAAWVYLCQGDNWFDFAPSRAANELVVRLNPPLLLTYKYEQESRTPPPDLIPPFLPLAAPPDGGLPPADIPPDGGLPPADIAPPKPTSGDDALEKILLDHFRASDDLEWLRFQIKADQETYQASRTHYQHKTYESTLLWSRWIALCWMCIFSAVGGGLLAQAAAALDVRKRA